MYKIWLRNKHIHIRTRVRLYNACIKSILTFNIAAFGLSDLQTNTLETSHRRYLHTILKIHHPHHISNNQLYKVTLSTPTYSAPAGSSLAGT